MYNPGSTKNPLTEARGIANISASKLARTLKLSRQYLSRADQGTYTNISPSLLAFTCDALELNQKNVMELYRKFQSDRRVETVEKVNPKILAIELTENSKPKFHYEYFRDWREEYWHTISQFSSQMCVHPGIVTNYESGTQMCMPFMLRDSLRQVNLLHSSFDTEVR